MDNNDRVGSGQNNYRVFQDNLRECNKRQQNDDVLMNNNEDDKMEIEQAPTVPPLVPQLISDLNNNEDDEMEIEEAITEPPCIPPTKKNNLKFRMRNGSTANHHRQEAQQNRMDELELDDQHNLVMKENDNLAVDQLASEEQQQVSEEHKHEQEEKQQANLLEEEEERPVAVGDEVEASNDPPVPSNNFFNFDNDSNEVEDDFINEIISVLGIDELDTRDGDEHNDGDKNIVNVDGDNDGITGDGDDDDENNDSDDLDRRFAIHQEKMEKAIQLQTPKNELEDGRNRYHLTESGQKLADVGFSVELARLGSSLIDTATSQSNNDDANQSAFDLICAGLRSIINSPTNISTDDALEHANSFRRNICHHFDICCGGIYRHQLNLGTPPSMYFTVLMQMNWAPPACIDYEDVEETDPSMKANKINPINQCILQLLRFVPASMTREASKKIINDIDDSDEKVSMQIHLDTCVNDVLQNIHTSMCIVDRLILVPFEKIGHEQEVETMMLNSGFQLNLLPLIPAIIVGLQSILSKSHNNRKKMILLSMGSDVQRIMRGTVSPKTMNAFVSDDGWTPHFESFCSRVIRNHLVHPQQKCTLYDTTLQSFYSSCESIIKKMIGTTTSTVVVRWADFIDNPFNEQDHKELFAVQSKQLRCFARFGFGGVDQSDRSKLMQDIFGYGTVGESEFAKLRRRLFGFGGDRQSDLSKFKQRGGPRLVDHIQDTCATITRGREKNK